MNVYRAVRCVAELLGAVVVSVAVGLVVQRRYRPDVRDTYAAIKSDDTDSVETSLGTVEYRMVGDGGPVLISHGIVGSFDQAIRTGKHLLDADARLIGVSHFSYLESNLPKTPLQKARRKRTQNYSTNWVSTTL